MRTLLKIFSMGAAACLGIVLGILLFSSLMLVEVEGSTMLPELEPGDRVLVLRTSSPFGEPELNPGDLVLYESPYYTLSGEGKQTVRRISGMRGDWLRLAAEVKLVESREIYTDRSRILGKVVWLLPRLEIF